MNRSYDPDMQPIRTDADRVGFRTHTLQPGETLVAAWVASRSLGRIGVTGGNLVLTNQRVLFEPIRTPKPSFLGKLLGGPVGGEVGSYVEETGLLNELSYPLPDIASVEPIGDRPPQLRLILSSGEAYDYQVLPGRWTTVFSRNTAARDEAVARISAAASPH